MFSVSFTASAELDFEAIFDFLVESYIGFGDAPKRAHQRARVRVQLIRSDVANIAKAPQRGTLHDDLMPGLRHVTLGQAVVWFEVVDAAKDVRVLAIFFGGQDHQRRMLTRLLGG